MSRYLIINADDFGLSEGVSRGILAAHHQGILTSTTFMANFPWAPAMAALLADSPDLGVGVHLNLTTGTPVLPPEQVPSLVSGEGRFSRSLMRLLTRADMGEVRREWSAQVERALGLLAPLGRHPTHLDSHRYLHGHPAFAQMLVEVARTYHIPAVRCMHPGPGFAVSDAFSAWNPAKLVVTRYLRRSAELIGHSGLGFPGAILARDFDLNRLLHLLEQVGEGVTELVSHPGRVDEQLRSLSSLQEHREAELAALTAPEARAAVERLGIHLVSFRHLAP